jgi:hypothetical protein
MNSLSKPTELSVQDRDYVENKLDELLAQLFERARGDTDRFTDMLSHYVAMTVAPSIAAANSVLRLPRLTDKNSGQPVRFTLSGDANYVGELSGLEADLAEAVTNAVLQTLLAPSPRILEVEAPEIADQICLN